MDFLSSSPVLISCPLGAAPFLVQELADLGFAATRQLPAAVEVRATMRECMRLNLFLRSANRVLFQLLRFTAADADQLYAELKRFAWENIIAPNGYLSVASSVSNDSIRDTRFANQKVKDAVVDRLRDKTGRRPDAGAEQTGTVLFLYWRGDECTIYLDTSGEPLSRRGYRLNPWKAPMQETLAAAAILATKWGGFVPVSAGAGANGSGSGAASGKGSQSAVSAALVPPVIATPAPLSRPRFSGHLLNPMCGSGTLAIEAALMSMHSAPAALRSNFCFMHVPDYRSEWWDALLDEAEDAENLTPDLRIIASDHNPEAVEIAKSNARKAGVDSLIEFSVCDFRQSPVPAAMGTQDVVIMNPEYGKRLGDERDLAACYEGVGDYFKQQCGGYTGYIFTGNGALAKKVGLRTSRRVPFFSADIECRLLEYELYSGTKKVRL